MSSSLMCRPSVLSFIIHAGFLCSIMVGRLYGQQDSPAAPVAANTIDELKAKSPALPAKDDVAVIERLIERQSLGERKQGTEKLVSESWIEKKEELTAAGFEAIFYNPEVLKRFGPKELVLENISVRGPVNLSNVEVGVPVLMRNCVIRGGLKMRGAKMVSLVMDYCEIGFFEGDGTEVTNDVVVGAETTFHSEFRLPHSKIGGALIICEGSRFTHNKEEDRSIDLSDTEVKGDVRVGKNGVDAKGVSLREAVLDGCLVLKGGTFGKLEIENCRLKRLEGSRPDALAVFGNDIKIRGALVLGPGTRSDGELSFRGAEMSSVWAESIEIEGSSGGLNFENARIGNSMVVRHVVVSQAGSALRLTRLQAIGDVEIESCSLQSSRWALDAGKISVGGRLILKNNDAKGGATLEGAKVGSDVSIQSGFYSSPAGEIAFSLNGANIGSSVSFTRNLDDDRATGVGFQGLVSLRGTQIGGDLTFSGGHTDWDGHFHDGVGLDKEVAVDKSSLILSQTSANRFAFPEECWRELKRIEMDGFQYTRLIFDGGDAGRSAASSVDSVRTLRDQACDLLKKGASKSGFDPQPYEHMAEVMRKMGHQKESREVLIAMCDTRSLFTQGAWMEWVWYGIIGRIVGYGYDPGRAFLLSVLWIIAASFVFMDAYRRGWIVDDREEPPAVASNPRWTAERVARQKELKSKHDAHCYLMQALPYSIEKFTPILSLGLRDKWKPKAVRSGEKSPGATFIQLFLWFHIIAGWFLASLCIGAITSLAK